MSFPLSPLSVGSSFVAKPTGYRLDRGYQINCIAYSKKVCKTCPEIIPKIPFQKPAAIKTTTKPANQQINTKATKPAHKQPIKKYDLIKKIKITCPKKIKP
jgi:hypothetical protein